MRRQPITETRGGATCMQTSIDGKEVAALYSELRDCLGANNQDQVKRVCRELVRAGRPLSEILGQAANIPDTVKKLEPLDASSQQSFLQQLVHLGSSSRNFDRVRPVPEPSDIANTATSSNHERGDPLLDEATQRDRTRTDHSRGSAANLEPSDLL